MYKKTNEMHCKKADCKFEFIFKVLFTETYCLQTETTDTLTKKQGNLELQWKTLIIIVLEMKQS